MIELSKHIEKLLLTHNCVIVPQLGGFIAQDVPARYVAEENLFLPPHRTVGFNPQLTLNDGLLVQSYMQAHDTNYPETLQLIGQAVENLKGEIQEKGEFELNGIGKIFLNLDGQYNFNPLEAGILSPALYGLDAVSVHLQERSSKKSKSASTISKKEKNPISSVSKEKNYIFSINKEFVNYVAVAIVTIFFYFVWATPVTDSTSMNTQQASIMFPHNVQRLAEKIPECKPVAAEAEALTDNANEQEVQNNIPENETPSVADNSEFFTIVLVSCIPEKNAEMFISQLKDERITDVSILKKRNIIRVIYGEYTSESEAYTELQKLHKENKRFKDAWVLHNK